MGSSIIRNMGCGGSEEDPDAAPVQVEEADTACAADSSDDEDGDFSVSVGLRIMVDGAEGLFLLGFDVGPKKKAKHVLRMVNHVLKLKMDKKLKKSLKHSEKEGAPHNALKGAEDGKEIYLIGGDNEQFDPSFWNQHLDFSADEFQKLECGSDWSDDSC